MEHEILEGMISLDAALKSGRRKIHRILIEKKRSERRLTETSYIKKRAQAKGIPISFVSSEEINGHVAGTTHGGILALVGPRNYQSVQSFIESGAKFVAIIEGIEDPYNFGFAVRSLYAAGCDALILPPRSWMSASGIVTKSSAGATEYIATAACDVVEAAQTLKDSGYRIIAADIPNSVSVYSEQANLSYPLVLVIGGEKRGINRALLAMADEVVRIDYGRQFKGALPAVSAASVLAFEIMRRNMGE